MVTKATSLCFPSRLVLLMIAFIVLQAATPFPSCCCVSARKLLQQEEEYSSPAPEPASGYGDEKGDDGSKSSVHGSASRHSGSANSDTSPTAKTVQMPPPTAVTRVSYTNAPPGGWSMTTLTKVSYTTAPPGGTRYPTGDATLDEPPAYPYPQNGGYKPGPSYGGYQPGTNYP